MTGTRHVNTVTTGHSDWHGTEMYKVHGEGQASSNLLGREDDPKEQHLSRALKGN